MKKKRRRNGSTSREDMMMEKEEKVDSLTKLYNEEQIDYLFHLAIANHHRFLL